MDKKHKAMEKKEEYITRIMFKKEDIIKFEAEIKKMDEIINASEKPKTVFDLVCGDKCFIIGSNGGVQERKYGYAYTERINQENIFLTEEDAEKLGNYRRTKTAIMKWKAEHDWEFVLDWESDHQQKYYAVVDKEYPDIRTYAIVNVGVVQFVESWKYFSSYAKVEECIGHIGWERWKRDIFGRK